MPFGIKPPSSSKLRPAPASSQTKNEAPKRRVGRPRKSDGASESAAQASAASDAVASDNGRAVTRSRSKPAASSTSVGAAQSVQKKGTKRHADDAAQVQRNKRSGQPANLAPPQVPVLPLPVLQPIDLADVARGLHALAESLEEQQASADSASTSTPTTVSLSDVQASFESLVSQYPEPALIDAAAAQRPAAPMRSGPWMPGQRVDRRTLAAAVVHLESLGYTKQSLKRVFTAQRAPAAGYAALGALVHYTARLIAVGLTPPDIIRLTAPSPAPLGRLVMALNAWQAAGLTVPFLVPVVMHEGASSESFGALMRHLSPYVAAGGEAVALLQPYYRNEGPAAFENMLREQQHVTSASQSPSEQATASTKRKQPAARRPQVPTRPRRLADPVAPLSQTQLDEAADDAQMLRQLISDGEVRAPIQQQRATQAQEGKRRLIRDMSDEARSDLGAFSPVLQDMGMSIAVVVQIATQSPLEAPLALVRKYAAVVVALGVSMKDVGKLALCDLSLETLRQFSIQAPALVERGLTPTQLVAFATTNYHVS